jgi:hypothetical protein
MASTAAIDRRSQTLARWGGPATMTAGALTIVEVLSPWDGATGSALFFVFLLFLLAGLAGFHTHQRHAYGQPTTVAMYALMAGSFAQAVAAIGNVFGTEAFQPLDDVGSLALLLGFLFYGGSTLRGRALPRWCGAAFISGFLGWVLLAISLGDTGGVLGGLWFGAVWIALGHALWTHHDSTTPHPPTR